MFVDEADQAVEFEQGILQGRRREQQLGMILQSRLEDVRNDVRGLVDVSQAVRFIDHHKIPGNAMEDIGFAFRELVGTDDDFRCLKRPQISRANRGVVGFRFEDAAGEEKFLVQLLIPLLPQIGRRDDENAPPPLSPFLGEHQAGLDCFSKADLIRKQRALGERRLEREEGRVHLMRIEVHLGIEQRARELLYAVWGAAFSQFMCDVFCVVSRGHCAKGADATEKGSPSQGEPAAAACCLKSYDTGNPKRGRCAERLPKIRHRACVSATSGGVAWAVLASLTNSANNGASARNSPASCRAPTPAGVATPARAKSGVEPL